MRLDKLLAHSGFGTRKEVKDFIKKGIVTVNGEIAEKDKMQVDPQTDEVCVNGEVITYEEFVYYMLNKPAGYVSATEDNLYPTVVDLIDDYYRDDLFPVGRLDVDTEGLLLISNDGVLAHQLLSPKKHCPKVYYAKINGIVTNQDVEAFFNGITIDDYQCQSAELKILSTSATTSEIEVTIYEGKFHQVKKMFLTVGVKVTALKRVQFGNFTLDSELAEGQYRSLNQDELQIIKNYLENS